MKKLYDFYLSQVKHTHYVELNFEAFGDMLTKLEYIVHRVDNEINGLLIYSVDQFVDINLVIGETSSYKPLIQALIAKTTKDIRIHYHKPYHLAWYAKEHMVHPNEQGVVYDSKLHKTYLELGFKETSIQETYFLDLKQFKLDKSISEKLESLNYQGYDVTLYNPLKHTGMDKFLTRLQSESFRNAIIANLSKRRPDPLLIVIKDNEVMGFSGPLLIADDFRGIFSGIEIVDEVRGLGLGKILFQKLCQTLKQMGAKYMTLFTGNKNAAKYIYLSAGFEIVQKFALMVYERES